MKKRNKKKFKRIYLFLFIVLINIFIISYYNNKKTINNDNDNYQNIGDIPFYPNNSFITINNNIPNFDLETYTKSAFEYYSNLDNLGRCGTAYANIDKSLMPNDSRESISKIKPTGWHTVKYDIISGKYLYNRCHLIGFQLTGENTNEKNLITCTRSMNVDGMLPFENMISDYINETNNHVLYRVTPIYDNNDLLAKGVQMEGYSLEDNGKSIKFNIFVYNIQNGISIDYKTGSSKLITN